MMREKITYHDLEVVLAQLGFKKRTENGHIFYEESAHDAVISLPNRQPDEPVLARHYVAARLVVDGMGVTDEKEFERVMKERGELPAGITTVV
jgi:hypothetical protein